MILVKWFRRRRPPAALPDLPVTWMLDNGHMLTFYPAREGLFIPWAHDAESGLCLPFYFERPPDPPFHPTYILLDDTLPKVSLERSTDPAEAWKGDDAVEEVPVYWEIFGHGVKAFAMHPDMWAALPDCYRLRFEPYEVKAPSSRSAGQTVKFR